MYKYILTAVVFVVGIIGVQFLDRSSTDIAVIALWYSYLCLTWNIVGGMSGQFTFAHPVYVGIGGYTSAVLFKYLGVSPWIGMFGGMALAAAAAIVLCWINFRTKLPLLTYALITLAVTIVFVILLRSSDFLGSHEGINIQRANSPWTFRFIDRRAYFYVILAAVCLMLALSTALLKSNLGRQFIAIRDNQDAAAMLGIDVLRTTMISSSISAGLGAFGGTFYAQYLSVIDPSVASVDLAVQIVLLTAVGGLGTVWGPFLGPVVLVPVERMLDRGFVNLAGLGNLFYGLLILLILLGLQNGVVSWMNVWIRRRRRKWARST